MRFPVIVAFAFSLGLWAGTASAERPTRPLGGYVQIDPSMADVSQHAAGPTIFLDQCAGGCTIYGGGESAQNNQSSIISGTANISEWSHGASAWTSLVSCVKGMFEPFGVTVTDQKPSSGNYFRSVVAGFPQEAGFSQYTGGVAPFSCGVINNSINYSFANIYQSVQQICEVVAQETAHVFGLDHELYCPDPLTYLSGCGPKSFKDYDAPCGENQARQCRCGGTTQNSVQTMLSIFGPGTPTPPTVEITEPADGANVQPGFVVRINAMDDVEITRAQLIIDGNVTMEITSFPLVFNAPDDLANGGHSVEVKVFDNRDTPASDQITVIIGEPCQCADGQSCVDGRCVTGPGQPGGLGEVCGTGEDCASGLCGTAGEDSFCAETCTAGNEYGCPQGFSCTSGVCWPNGEPKDGGGGCSVGGDSSPYVPASLALLVGLLLYRRRKR